MCMYLCVIWLCSDAYQYESYGQPGAEAAGYGGYGKYPPAHSIHEFYIYTNMFWMD